MSHPLNNVVFCKLAPSPIHGVGVFAIRDIPKGTNVIGGQWTYSRENEETILPEIWDLIRDHYAQVEKGMYIPNPNGDVKLKCFMNHSNTPNCDGTFTLRDILKGEEMTEDYRQHGLGANALKHFHFL